MIVNCLSDASWSHGSCNVLVNGFSVSFVFGVSRGSKIKIKMMNDLALSASHPLRVVVVVLGIIAAPRGG